MRRKDREASSPEFYKYVLSRAEILYLAFNTSDDFPYCIPVNFALSDNKIYIHSALEGRKLDLLAADNRVAFSCAIDVSIDTEKFTTYYKSVCGIGRGFVCEDFAEKQLALDLIASRYNALCPRPAPASAVKRVSIIRVDIISMSGKRHLP